MVDAPILSPAFCGQPASARRFHVASAVSAMRSSPADRPDAAAAYATALAWADAQSAGLAKNEKCPAMGECARTVEGRSGSQRRDPRLLGLRFRGSRWLKITV